MTSTVEHGAGTPPGGVRVRASMPTRTERTTASLLVSVLLHAGIIALVVYATAQVVEHRGGAITDALTRASGGGGGGGGGGGTYVAVAPPRVAHPPEALTQVPIVPPPLPSVTPTPEPAVTPPARDSAPASSGGTAAGAGSGGGTGGGQGTGTGTGTGSGTGPGSGGGTGGGAAALKGREPEPRQYMIPPVDMPKSLRGKTVTVTFIIAADGRVTQFDVAPPIADRDYSRKFNEVLRAFRFRPARDSTGATVAGKLTMDVTF